MISALSANVIKPTYAEHFMKISQLNFKPSILGRSFGEKAASKPKSDILTAFQTPDHFSLSGKLAPEAASDYVDSLELGPSRSAFTETFIEAVKEHKGDGAITFLASPTARRSQSEHVAEGMRLDDGYGLVLDPGQLEVDGWSAKDYASHWNQVRETFSDDMKMVMAPGWQSSKGCKEAALHADSLGIPIIKLETQSLTRTDIEIRLAESEEELRQRGFEPPAFVETLNGAVDQKYLDDTATGDFTSDETLKDPISYVSDVVARTLNGKDEVDNDGARQAGKMPQPEFTKLYVEAALEQLDGRPMTYVSTPITGGRKKFELFEDLGVKDKTEFDKSGKKRFVKDVIVANTNRAYRISEAVRENQDYGMVMDPSEITIPEWSQSHYAAHWDAVVKELASKVVLAPGWDFSSGCILELKRALDKGVPVEEVALKPMASRELDPYR